MSPRVLIVEDEVIIAMSLEMELRQMGCEVCQSVIAGEDAVRVAHQEAPDCIFMDIGLAGDIDGIEAARRIQAQTDIPIVFMTGYPDKTVEERARGLNTLGYLTKPVRARTLKPLIESLRG